MKQTNNQQPSPAQSDQLAAIANEVTHLRRTQRSAIAIDLAAVSTSLGFNLSAAPATVGGWLVGAVAPLFLFAAIGLWHRAHGVLDGWLGHLFNLGLAGVAAMAGFLSFDHIRHVAVEVGGQTPTGGAVVALVVDALAVLAALVVIGAGTKIQRLEASHGQARAVEADRVSEAERRAKEEWLKAEAAERARQADHDANREPAAPEPIPSTTRKSAAEPKTRRTSETPATNGDNPYGPATNLVANDRIQLYLADHPDATRGQVATACEVDPSTVKRSAAWKAHRAIGTSPLELAARP